MKNIEMSDIQEDTNLSKGTDCIQSAVEIPKEIPEDVVTETVTKIFDSAFAIGAQAEDVATKAVKISADIAPKVIKGI